MRRNLLFTLLVLTSIAMNAQKFNASSLLGSWRLNWVKAGFFPNDDLLFEKADGFKGQYIFRFEKDGNLKQLLTDAELDDCPVGVFVVEKGSWSFSEGYLTLVLKGAKIADYDFDYEIVYSPKKELNILKLLLVEVSRDERAK